MNTTRLFDKVYGCLLASAIGNAMGSPVENQHYKDIEKRYGKIETLLDPDRLELEDDNQIGLLLCRAYIEKQGPVVSDDLARVWLRDLDPKRFFWCIRNAYELLKRGISPRLTGMFNIVTGSAIMAIAPVGIYNACDPDRAYIDAIDIGYMYQPELDVEVACILAACVAEAMKPDSTAESIISIALEKASSDPKATFDERSPDNIKDTLKQTLDIAGRYDDIFAVREELYQKVLQWHPIDPLEVLTLSLAMFRVSGGDTRRAIVGGVNIGRDSDTISNLCGALAGAMNGIGSVPKEWVSMVKPETVEIFRDTAAQMADLIRKRTDAMADQIASLKQLL